MDFKIEILGVIIKNRIAFCSLIFTFQYNKYSLLPTGGPHKSTVKSFGHSSPSKFPAHLLFMVNNRALIKAIYLSARCCGVWSLFFIYLSLFIRQRFARSLSAKACFNFRIVSVFFLLSRDTSCTALLYVSLSSFKILIASEDMHL